MSKARLRWAALMEPRSTAKAFIGAVFASGCLLRFDPAGKLERRVLLPVKYPTMPAFGGEGLNTLFVTSANWPLSHEERNRRPNEGGLFAMEAPAPGLRTTPFNLARNP